MARRTFHFSGFTPGLFRFLAGLNHNNNREWFNRNRRYYEANVLIPIKLFTDRIGVTLRLLDGNLETDPRVGKTISRINNLRPNRERAPYRSSIYVTFPRRTPKLSQGPLLYVGFYARGVAAGFCPGGANALATVAIQQGIKNNLKLFQHYLGERRVANRYSELVSNEEGQVTRWPLPKTARRWTNLESFTVGEFFEQSDPVLYTTRCLDRILEVIIDLYPLWLFAVSDNLKEDLDTYRDTVALITQPHATAAD